MSGQQATITRADTTGAKTSTVRMLVPWSQGEQTSIATVRNTRAVRVGATTYPTRWRVRGAPHNDGSLRFTYAEWRMEVANGNLASGAAQHTAEVVEYDNSGTGAASFAAWADELSITLAYTAEDSSSVSVDIAAQARAGTDGSIYRVSDEGGTRFIHYETWIGPGRRHEPRRSLYAQFRNTRGPSVGNNVVVRSGLLHVVCTIEIRDQDDHALVELQLRNDAAYPYPSAPPDGGERQPGRPARPTQLNPAATNPITNQVEQLESPLFRQFASGITATIAHGSTVYARPFYVANHTTGAGPFGTITSSGNGTTVLPIRGLADSQCWGIRFAVSSVSLSEAEFWASHNRNGFLAIPTYATWLATERWRDLVGGEVDGDRMTRLGWDFALYEGIPSTTITAWRLRGHTASNVRFMNQTFASPWRVGWKSWRGDNVNSGGKHFGVGFLHEGEAILAGSPEFLYRTGGFALREATARPFQLENQSLEDLDLLTDTGGSDDYTAYIWGTGASPQTRGIHPTSIMQFGRRQQGNLSVSNPVANYNGTTAVRTNPDPEQDLDFSGPNWQPMQSTHMGIRPLFLHALITDSAADRYLMRQWANLALINFPMRTFPFADGPAQQSIRGEARPLWICWHGFVIDDDAAWRSRVQVHCSRRIAAWINPASRCYWNPIGWSLTPGYRGGACGNDTTQDVDDMIQWWLAGPACETAGNWLLDASSDAFARDIGTAIMYLSRHTVDYGFWCNPAQIPAAAQRNSPNGFDSCFAARAANPNIDTYPVHGLIVPAGSRANRAASAGTSLVMQNVHDRANTRNHAQNSQQWPALPISLVFAANRARAGHTDRVAFIRQAMLAIFPELQNGSTYSDDEEQHLGFMSGDSYRPTTQGPPPVASFTVSTRSGTIPLAVTLNPAASVINGNTAVATYRWWDNYIVGATPSATGTGVPGTRNITYTGPGLYRPALEITQEDGQAHLYVDGPGIDARPAIIPAPAPRFNASAAAVTAGGAVQFTYIETGGRALSYDWEYKIATEPTVWTAFGNGARDPVWTAPVTTGLYDFRVTATNETGSGVHTEEDLVRVTPTPNTAPRAYFDPNVTSGNVPLEVSFNASATTFAGAAASVTWDWWADYDPAESPDESTTGPGGSSFETTYTTPGRKRPGLVVTQADGQSSLYVYEQGIVVTSIPIEQPPTPDFSIDTTALEVAETQVLSYIERGYRALSWVWQKRASGETAWTTFSTERLAVFTAEEAGIFDVRVVATNEHGSTAKEYLGLVTVSGTDAPQALFTVDVTSGQYPLTVTFDASSSTVNGVAASAEWNWYADATQTEPTETIVGTSGDGWEHEYELPGNYIPKLVLVQSDGQESTYVLPTEILVTTDPATDPPAGTITADDVSVEPGQRVILTWNDAGILATSWIWYYSADGSTWLEFARTNPCQWIAPATAGEYSFRCEATNANGTTTVDADGLVEVVAGSAPTASFTVSKAHFLPTDPLYPQPFLTVTDASTGAESWTWRVDPAGSIFYGQTPPAFQLSGKGRHKITLIVSNSYGISTVSKYVTVQQNNQRVVVRDPRGVRTRIEREGV